MAREYEPQKRSASRASAQALQARGVDRAYKRDERTLDLL